MGATEMGADEWVVFVENEIAKNRIHWGRLATVTIEQFLGQQVRLAGMLEAAGRADLAGLVRSFTFDQTPDPGREGETIDGVIYLGAGDYATAWFHASGLVAETVPSVGGYAADMRDQARQVHDGEYTAANLLASAYTAAGIEADRDGLLARLRERPA